MKHSPSSAAGDNDHMFTKRDIKGRKGVNGGTTT